VKSTDNDFEAHWATVATGGTGLDATGVTAGYSPKATGFNTWAWGAISVPVLSVNGEIGVVILDAADIAETAVRKWLTDVERTKLNHFSTIPTYTDLAGLPALGTAADKNTTFFHVAGSVVVNTDLPKVTGLRGTSRGTAAPSGGVDGDQYRQYT
jgi:hypothetical protein